MKTSGVARISVVTTWECEEPVSALLERVFSVSPSVYSDAETKDSIVTAYVRARPEQIRASLPEIESRLQELRGMGLEVGSGELQVAAVRKEDWAESWKKHFKPLRIGSSLLVQPSWSKLKAKPGQAVVTLDPGLSFGTGQHATTDFCLHQIVAFRGGNSTPTTGRKRRSGSGGGRAVSLLDVGCGSGILAIAAAKLGYAAVTAFDFDPVAVRVAQKNCRINRVEKKVAVTRKDLTKVPLNSREKYNVVCANLMAPLLIAERERILNRLAAGGTLILAGILATEFESVRDRYESAGMQLIGEKSEREWRSGAFRREERI